MLFLSLIEKTACLNGWSYAGSCPHDRPNRRILGMFPPQAGDPWLCTCADPYHPPKDGGGSTLGETY